MLSRTILLFLIVLLGVNTLSDASKNLRQPHLFTTSFTLSNDSLFFVNLPIPYLRKGEEPIRYYGFTLLYSEAHEQAAWVAYSLSGEQTQSQFKRTNRFLPDTLIPTGSANDQDYRGSGYDRGHLAPAGDMGWSERSMKESFFYSNMSPQVPAFNRGVWNRLEQQVRKWAVDHGKVYITTGPVLTDSLPVIGPNRVAVPAFYYKVVLYYSDSLSKGIGFIMPNKGLSDPLSKFAISIDSVEKVTGINFFPAVPDETEEKIEKNLCVPCWKW